MNEELRGDALTPEQENEELRDDGRIPEQENEVQLGVLQPTVQISGLDLHSESEHGQDEDDLVLGAADLVLEEAPLALEQQLANQSDSEDVESDKDLRSNGPTPEQENDELRDDGLIPEQENEVQLGQLQCIAVFDWLLDEEMRAQSLGIIERVYNKSSYVPVDKDFELKRQRVGAV